MHISFDFPFTMRDIAMVTVGIALASTLLDENGKKMVLELACEMIKEHEKK